MSPSAETTPEPERDIGADLPLTQAVAQRSFDNPEHFAASIMCAMSCNSSPQTKSIPSENVDDTLSLHSRSQHTERPDKRRQTRNGLTLRRSSVGPLRIGKLEITIHGWIGPQSTVENQVDIVLKAPARTIEAVRQVASTKAWELHYRLSVTYWKDGVIFVECCIEVPPNLMNKISDITSMVESLSEVAKSFPEAGHSEYIILVNRGESEIVEDSEDDEEGLYE